MIKMHIKMVKIKDIRNAIVIEEWYHVLVDKGCTTDDDMGVRKAEKGKRVSKTEVK